VYEPDRLGTDFRSVQKLLRVSVVRISVESVIRVCRHGGKNVIHYTVHMRVYCESRNERGKKNFFYHKTRARTAQVNKRTRVYPIDIAFTARGFSD